MLVGIYVLSSSCAVLHFDVLHFEVLHFAVFHFAVLHCCVAFIRDDLLLIHYIAQ